MRRDLVILFKTETTVDEAVCAASLATEETDVKVT